MLLSTPENYPQSDLVNPLTREEEFLFGAVALLNLMSCPLPGIDKVRDFDDMVIDEEKLFEAACDRLKPFEHSAEHIGLPIDQQVLIYKRAFQGNQEGINEVIERSEDKMDRDDMPTSIDLTDEVERELKHQAIVDSLLKNVKSSWRPKVTIIAGPFAAGKTEIFQDRFKKDDKKQVVIDLDEIRGMLMDGYDPTNQQHVQYVRRESWIVSDLLFMTALKQKKSVVVQTALHRDRWLNDPAILYAVSKRIPIEVNMLLRPITDCMMRNIHRERAVAMRDLVDSMNGMRMIIPFVEKFKKRVKVNLIDFHPLIKIEQVMLPKFFQEEYRRLIEYANAHRKSFTLYEKKRDLGVLTKA